METLQTIISLVANGGAVAVLVAYMIYKDLVFTNKINDLLVQMKETLDFIKDEKETMIALIEEMRAKHET